MFSLLAHVQQRRLAKRANEDCLLETLERQRLPNIQGREVI
jgi:hypothetical protein